MAPISSAASAYGRVASSGMSPVERLSSASATQVIQSGQGGQVPQPQASNAAAASVQRPSAVVIISPQARERAEAADRENASQAEAAAEASPRAQAATEASQNQFVMVAAAQNATSSSDAEASGNANGMDSGSNIPSN